MANTEMSLSSLAAALKKANIELFRDRTGLPLSQAQRNLEGKSEYVSDASLKLRNGSIHACHALDEGLILGIVESFVPNDEPEGSTKYRPVFFDVFGNVIYKPDTKDCPKSLRAAQGAFWTQSEEFKAVEATIKGLELKQAKVQQQLDDLKQLSKDLK